MGLECGIECFRAVGREEYDARVVLQRSKEDCKRLEIACRAFVVRYRGRGMAR